MTYFYLLVNDLLSNKMFYFGAEFCIGLLLVIHCNVPDNCINKVNQYLLSCFHSVELEHLSLAEYPEAVFLGMPLR